MKNLLKDFGHFSKNKFPRDPTLIYKGAKLETKKDSTGDKISRALVKVATAVSSRSLENVILLKKIQLVQYLASPYTDADLAKMEAATRRNLAVRSGLTVRQHFAFGKGSKLVVELFDSDKFGLDQTQINDKIKELIDSNKEILQQLEVRDTNVQFVKHYTGTYYWQKLMFGRGVILKLFRDDGSIKRLLPLNSRRLGDPILDRNNDMEFEGVYIDGQPVDRFAIIYGTYQERQISPHTEYFGYSAIEPIVHIAECHNIATEEDFKEILKSAWLKSILFKINTAGLKADDATTKIQTIIDAIEPAKYIGTNGDVEEMLPLDLDPKYDGLVLMVDSLESKIFKALFVPQFLVQSEDMANRATANKSATLFIDGIVTHDQNQASEEAWEQWYEPELRKLLKKELNPEDPLDKEPEQLPFKITRRWDKPTIEEFLDMAAAVAQLVQNHVWDVQQANKVLGTEEVTKRVMDEMKRQEEMMQAQTGPDGKPITKPNGIPTKSEDAQNTK